MCYFSLSKNAYLFTVSSSIVPRVPKKKISTMYWYFFVLWHIIDSLIYYFLFILNHFCHSIVLIYFWSFTSKIFEYWMYLSGIYYKTFILKIALCFIQTLWCHLLIDKLQSTCWITLCCTIPEKYFQIEDDNYIHTYEAVSAVFFF